MRTFSRALVLASLIAVAVSPVAASAGDVVIQPGSNPVIIQQQPQPQPGSVVVQPAPSASVVSPAPVTVVPAPSTTVVVPGQPWCGGVYAPGLGTNFGPCPAVTVQTR